MVVRLEDLAQITGLSKAAVSMALHDHPRVSEETRKRVKSLASKMGYEANAHARSLSTSKSNTIGVLMPNSEFESWPFYYLDPLLRSIRGHAARAGYDVLMAGVERDRKDRSGLLRLVMQQKVDGLVAISTKFDPQERDVLVARNFPVVMVHAIPEPFDTDPFNDFSCFFTDNILGGRLAGEHLVRKACRKILCLANNIETPEMHDRRAGFEQAVNDSGLACDVLYSHSGFFDVSAFVAERINQFSDYDGIFCLTDIMACALIQTLQQYKVSVPEKVRVIGYDDIEIGTYWTPKLTTIHQPGSQIVASACANLVRWIERPELNKVIHKAFPPELVIRESA